MLNGQHQAGDMAAESETLVREATLTIAKQTDILNMMREARFDTIFVGIETPELAALKAICKEQNASLPMLEAIQTLNRYGLEVVSGIILGLDSDTAETEARLNNFVDRSQVPMLTMNLLQALPKTPLWERLVGDGRLVHYDQFDNAAHLRCLGVSRTVARDRYTPAHVATILRGLLDTTEVRRGCAAIATRFGASTALSSAADALEQYWKKRDGSY
jgi:radical SAM superfamily enzyme YgiQ (UPF0313 family)